ncbi:MAG: SIS domain-containing protein [Candidatus Thermoplasmatota archaeon]|nr:SIS domain-containing protein [Candidatus Thermoplasmatota archaeon]
MRDKILEHLDTSIKCINNLKKQADKIEKIAKIIQVAKNKNKKVFLFGNGGSASTASHLVCDFAKFKGLKALALTDDIPLITAWSNDEDYSVIFKEQLKSLLEKGDVVIGISGSGKSKNVLEAIKYANEKGAYTIGLAGFDGGELKKLAKECLVVEIASMQHSEDMHLLIGHLLASLLK